MTSTAAISSTYAYRAIRRDGVTVTGTVEATTEELARVRLSELDIFPTTLQRRTPLSRHTTAIPIGDLALGLRVLANLLESGLPIGKTLSAFEELAPSSWHAGLPAVRNAIRDGATLATALASSSLAIPPVVIGILHAGEMGTGLGPAVRRAAELMERTAATRSAIRNALAYPMILAAAGTISLIFLVGVVLPKFAGILHDLGQTLPRTTQVVLHTSTVLRTMAFPMGIVLTALFLVWKFWIETPAGRLSWHHTLRQLPVIGAIRHCAATARTSAAMGSLLESGVPVATALIHASRAAGDATVESGVLEARTAITHGERLSHAMETTEALTPTAIRLLRAGEESGRLASMFTHAAAIEQERAEQTVRTMVRLLEPSLILIFGGVVAFVAAALLQAVYSIRPTH